MVLDKKYYIESIAGDVRRKIVEKGIIAENSRNLTISQIEKIVELFDGKLELLPDDYEKSSPYIEKTGKESYTIYYKKENNYLFILHELGHAFLDLENMEKGEILYFEGIERRDLDAALFARALIMPRKNFEEVVIAYLNNGKCNIHNIAREYEIEYLEILARGEELNIWE